MKAKILSFRRSIKRYTPKHFIIEVETKDIKSLIGKKVIWTSPSGKKIEGIVSATHGKLSKSGISKFRTIFEKGLPGQAINNIVEII